MAVFRLIPHMDDSVVSIDVQYTSNPYGAWTSIATNDAVANYPKKFDVSAITDKTYLRFRFKYDDDSYSDWSTPSKAQVTYKPEPNAGLCYIYGRLVNVDTQEPLNSPRISFEYVSGTAEAGVPLVRNIIVDGDNNGWFIIALTPGITYTANCPDASIDKEIVIPETHNAKFSEL